MNKIALTGLLATALFATTGFSTLQSIDVAKAAPKDGDEVAVMDTDKGKIVLMFFPEVSPKHVENFKSLAQKGFYDGTRFHRCMEGFMIQGGDPNSKDLANFENTSTKPVGTGGNTDEEGKRVLVKAEFNQKIPHHRGVLSMARGPSPDSASSQFFIMHRASAGLDGQYSSFGKVVEGMDVVDIIVKTGSTDRAANGRVEPEDAVVVKSVKILKWPLKKEGN